MILLERVAAHECSETLKAETNTGLLSLKDHYLVEEKSGHWAQLTAMNSSFRKALALLLMAQYEPSAGKAGELGRLS